MSSNFDLMTTDELSKKSQEYIIRNKVSFNTERLNIYLAGPWFDNHALILYNTVKTIANMCDKVSNFNIYYPKDNNFDTPKETFKANVKALNECDIVLALISRKDVGTAWELGFAYATGKDIYLLGMDKTCFESKTNIMLAFNGTCFTLDKLGKFLTEGLADEDRVDMSNTWEDKE
jgi:nucleoside 2-deoxyribosyltransferase